MKKCKFCMSDLNPGDKICPKCHQKQSMPGWQIALIVIFTIIIVLFAISKCVVDTLKGAADAVNDVSDSLNDTVDEIQSTLDDTLTDEFTYTVTRQYKDTYSYYVEGTITNSKDKDYSYVQVEFICYDKDGNNIGTALDNTNNLLGNQTWKFKAMGLFTDSTVDHCDYYQVTGW